MSQNYDLIRVITEDQIYLSGLYQPGEIDKPAIIFIHGFTSDFYSPVFPHTIGSKLKSNNYALLLAQNRGTGIETEFIKTNGHEVFLGSFFERIEDAHLDINAHIEFLLNEGYTEIILMGHSLGTIKVTRYIFEGKHKDKIKKLTLLAPFDKNAFMAKRAASNWDQFLEIAHQKIDQGKGREIVPTPEYEDYPLSYTTFLSWYNKTELSCIWDFYRSDYDGDVLKKIPIPVQVILGDKDEFVTYPEFNESPRTVLNFLKKTIPQCETHLIPRCNHTYTDKEEEVAKLVTKFVSA